MANDICILCWKKDATEVFVAGKVRVCRGCKYEVDRVLNFMAYFGYGMGEVDTVIPGIVKADVSPKPPTPKKPAKGSPKHVPEVAKLKEEAQARQGTLDEALEGD